MESLETELARARELEVSALAEAIESIGFECTRCGACCKGYDPEDPADEDTTGRADGESNSVSDSELESESESESESVAESGVEFESGSQSQSESQLESESGSRGETAATTSVSNGTDSTDSPAGSADSESLEESPTREPHTATVFPDEVREIETEYEYDWRDVARPMPYGITEGADGNGPTGETFEWALAVNGCGDCAFYEETDGNGECTVHDDRPLICQTYPFSVALGGTSQPMGEAVDEAGMVRAHECEGLGRDISHAEATRLAEALKERAIRELQEAIGVRDEYDTVSGERVVVHDSEGAKRPDGSLIN